MDMDDHGRVWFRLVLLFMLSLLLGLLPQLFDGARHTPVLLSEIPGPPPCRWSLEATNDGNGSPWRDLHSDPFRSLNFVNFGRPVLLVMRTFASREGDPWLSG